ncbi:nuclear transport factor 2 family protein [Paractinoplanes rhizophilus]|uniref:Nuclear transport factor 2 family protein n=1 Tax=Paractinoplanes rhizophilus TaxID=1416877 RepID=A0ABW2HPW0_9ACTN
MEPREVFERAMRPEALTGEVTGDHLADDVVVEWPFAAPGRPRRIEGKSAFLAMAAAAREAMPFRIDRCSVGAVHETSDPEVIVVEYTLGGVRLATGERGATDLICVLRVRDGKVVHWREYQDTQAIAQAMGA